MKVYFLRHGIAADRERWKGVDADRPLTDQGRERMAAEAKTIANLNLDLACILTSPLVRAVETARIVAERLKLGDKVKEEERLDTDFDAERLAAIIQENSKADAIMLVGHDPSMTEMIAHLAGGARVDFKKGGLACIDVRDPASLNGTLLWLLTPKILTL